MQMIYTRGDQFPKYRGKKVKVLLNAGGGLFGYVITYLMSKLDFDLYSKIDVVCGSSIGGILSLLYSVNSDYEYINTLFKRHGKQCFTKRSIFGSLNPPTYDNKYLRKFIQKILSDYTLNDINKLNHEKLKVIIPTLDLTLTCPRMFTNIVDQYDQHMLQTKLVDIGLMTAAAPTYFQALPYQWKQTLLQLTEQSKLPRYQQRYLLAEQAIKRLNLYPGCKHESAIIDSGVIENIPVFSTYTTLRSRLGVKLQDIDMLIIGTGDDMTPDNNIITQNVNRWNLIDWLTKFIIKFVTQSNELTSINFGAQMGFHSFRVFNPLNVTGDMDDASIMQPLEKQCDQVIQNFKQTIQDFLNQPK